MFMGHDQMDFDPADPCRAVWEGVNARLKDLRRSRIANEGKLLLIGDLGWLSAWNQYDPNRTEWHTQPYSHNLAYMDGHVELVRIRKGLHVTNQYTAIPFADLATDAAACQQEVPTP